MHNGEKTEFLDIKLEQYAKSDYYPFHMPGHKRVPFHMPDPYTIDITEIDGFDNLSDQWQSLWDFSRHIRSSSTEKDIVNGKKCP